MSGKCLEAIEYVKDKKTKGSNNTLIVLALINEPKYFRHYLYGNEREHYIEAIKLNMKNSYPTWSLQKSMRKTTKVSLTKKYKSIYEIYKYQARLDLSTHVNI